MNALVTGAGGFVGGAIAAKILRDRSNSVVGFFRDKPAGWIYRPSGSDEAPAARATAVFGDVTDTDAVQRALADYRIDTIFHLAAEASVRVCREHPRSAYMSNVVGTVSVLEACRRQGEQIKRIVVASTDKVYGASPAPYREEQPLLGDGIYASSKTAADVAARAFAMEYRMPIRIVRSCNVVGPGDLDMTRIVPRSIDLMLGGRPAVLYSEAQGMVREFVYIEDEIDAYLTVADRGADGEAYNVSGVGPTRVGDLMEMLAKFCDGSYEVIEGGLVEIKEQWMDGSKLMALGWKPHVALDGALLATIEWHKRRRGP